MQQFPEFQSVSAVSFGKLFGGSLTRAQQKFASGLAQANVGIRYTDADIAERTRTLRTVYQAKRGQMFGQRLKAKLFKDMMPVFFNKFVQVKAKGENPFTWNGEDEADELAKKATVCVLVMNSQLEAEFKLALTPPSYGPNDPQYMPKLKQELEKVLLRVILPIFVPVSLCLRELSSVDSSLPQIPRSCLQASQKLSRRISS
jgi:hypothetical protein